ncbi:hypothetical protein [Rothia sp. ZJ932]|uniref:hypothetical protein n=1 Tax=Rothia sp. ZJ932 TaxID=2810516 RepID=UPI001967FFDD|nr:hypothetical protein [Rothia sp. ZJ932]QRZ61373.1 hypothetical protein JR346_09110 [Rothia sp. ZJ932]
MSAFPRHEATAQIIRNAQPAEDNLTVWGENLRHVLSVKDLEIHQRYLSATFDDAMKNTLETAASFGSPEHELELVKAAEVANHLAAVEAALMRS